MTNYVPRKHPKELKRFNYVRSSGCLDKHRPATTPRNGYKDLWTLNCNQKKNYVLILPVKFGIKINS